VSRPSDRDDRKAWRQALLVAVPILLWMGWVIHSVLVEKRIPLRRGSDVLLATNPTLFWLLVAVLIGAPLLVLGAVLVLTLAGRRSEDARIDRRLSLALDKGVRTPYEPADMSDNTYPLIIAVDGPAASGKGTIAARLAATYGLPHLDTGLLYRAVGVGVLDAGGSLDDAATAETVALKLDASHLTDTDRLTSGEAGEAASRIAGYPGVRAALLAFQKAFAAQAGGAVLDGRDIGTVIAPEAQAKLFITATPEVRATRRWKQLTARGQDIAFEAMLADIIKRDERDAGRGAAPMVQAEDAVLLDTTDMDIEAAFDAARRIVEAARAKHGL
jgi:cytidylate kinase